MFRPADAIPHDEGDVAVDVFQVHDTLVNMHSIVASVLHDFQIAHATSLLDNELGWWVSPDPPHGFHDLFSKNMMTIGGLKTLGCRNHLSSL